MNKLQLAEEIQIDKGKDRSIFKKMEQAWNDPHPLVMVKTSLSCSGRSKHSPPTLKVRVKEKEMWKASITPLLCAHPTSVKNGWQSSILHIKHEVALFTKCC
jgi:hypothetical protein